MRQLEPYRCSVVISNINPLTADQLEANLRFEMNLQYPTLGKLQETDRLTALYQGIHCLSME